MGNIALSVCAEVADTREILDHLQERIGPQKFNAWFRHGASLSLDDRYVQLAVPNPFVANWIESHYRADVAAAVKAHTGRAVQVVITVDPTLSGTLRKGQFDRQAKMVARTADGRMRQRPDACPAPLRHRLKDFVVGESNRLAYAAVGVLLKNNAPSFHVLFVHGSCGVGKTHLLQGICNAHGARSHGQVAARWRYVTGEQFTNEFVTAVRRKQFGEFRDRYRKLELLAIDDVHFLAAKKAVQGEFLHTFNAIEAAGKRIVLASDAHPRMVGELNEQLTSRFVAGMVVRIDPPDRDTRREILCRKAKNLKLHVSEGVLDYVAHHIRGSVRELEGTLFKLAALSSLAGGPVGMQMARDALGDYLCRTDNVVTLGDIEAATAAFFGITPADIHSSRRMRTISVARMVAMYLGRKHTSMSYPEIGKFMGKNHSSVILAVKRMETALAGDKDLTWRGVMGAKSMSARKVARLLTNELS